MHTEEVAAMIVEVGIKLVVAEQVDVFDLVNGCGCESQGQPDVLRLAEMKPHNNTGYEDQSIPDKMHHLAIQFAKNAMGLAAISLPAPAQAGRIGMRTVDEDELEHLHHMLADMPGLQNHDNEVQCHEPIVLAGPEYLHGEKGDPGEDGSQGNGPERPVEPDADQLEEVRGKGSDDDCAKLQLAPSQ